MRFEKAVAGLVGFTANRTTSELLPVAIFVRYAFVDFHSVRSQLSVMDASVQATMKGTAKCDKRRELQSSVNRQIPERILFCQVIPCSTPASVSGCSSCTTGVYLFVRELHVSHSWVSLACSVVCAVQFA